MTTTPKKKRSTLQQSIWSFLSPKYWLTWSAMGAAWVLAQLPWSWQLLLGRLLGGLLYRLGGRRRHICLTNLALCYPNMTLTARTQLAKRHFQSMGMGVFEMFISWFKPRTYLADRVSFVGADLLEQALAQGRGCILIGGHFSSIDLCGSHMSRFVPVHPIYKLQSNKVINWVMERQRQRTFEKTIERSNMREVVRSLKQNRVVWYAVDQDYGRQHSVFADFFGQRCATIAHIGRVANLTNAPVLLYGYHRHQQGYHLSLHAMPADFPSQLEVENATIMNQQMEWLINQHPEQYFWTHRRFKTQEKADAPSPY